MYYYTIYNSPIGKLTLISDDNYLVGLTFKENCFLKYLKKEEIIKRDNHPILKDTAKWLDQYFRQEKPTIENIKIKFLGSEFQIMVWNYLLQIPYGSLTTYGEIAKKISQKAKKKMANQAVGNAIRNNPIGIIVPCHRVIGNNNLGGFNAGLDKKIQLLTIEGHDLNKLDSQRKKGKK